MFLSFALLNSPVWAFQWDKVYEDENEVSFLDKETIVEAINNKQNIKEFWVKSIHLDDSLQKDTGLPQNVSVLIVKVKTNCKNKTFAIEEVRMWDLQEKQLINTIKTPVSKLDWTKMHGKNRYGILATKVCEFN